MVLLIELISLQTTKVAVRDESAGDCAERVVSPDAHSTCRGVQEIRRGPPTSLAMFQIQPRPAIARRTIVMATIEAEMEESAGIVEIEADQADEAALRQETVRPGRPTPRSRPSRKWSREIAEHTPENDVNKRADCGAEPQPLLPR